MFQKRVFALLLCTLALITPAAAQVLKGQILGTITDQSGGVVPGVKISITETRPNFQRSSETNEGGSFVFVNLDPGDYKVEAEKQGFSKTLRSGIDLQPNTTARVNFELVPGAVTQTVDVSATAAPLLQTVSCKGSGNYQNYTACGETQPFAVPAGISVFRIGRPGNGLWLGTITFEAAAAAAS